MRRLVLSVVFLAGLTACAPSDSRFAFEAGRRETGQPALHAIHDGQLRESMDRMDSLMHERFMTVPELDAERRGRARQIAVSAQNLSQTVDAIQAALPSLHLDAAEQAAFLALVGKLRAQALNLRELAEQDRLDAIPAALQQMSTTCVSCHALFRKL